MWYTLVTVKRGKMEAHYSADRLSNRWQIGWGAETPLKKVKKKSLTNNNKYSIMNIQGKEREVVTYDNYKYH